MRKRAVRMVGFVAALLAVTAIGVGVAHADDGTHWGAPAVGQHVDGIIWD